MTDITAVGILREARDLIATPDRWTQQTMALDKYGWEVPPEDPQACRWCLIGAYCAVMARITVSMAVWNAVVEALRDCVREKGHHRYSDEFNDDRATTHADILALYDDAIQAAERGRA